MKMIHQLIMKCGQKYRFDLGYFAKNWFWLVLAHMITTVKGIILIVLFTNYFWLKEFWEYSFILSVIWVVSILWLPWAGIAIIQSVSRWFLGTFRYLLLKILKVSILWSFTLFFIGIFLDWWIKYPYYIVFIVIATFFPLYTISSFNSYYFTWIKRFDLRAKTEFFVNILLILSWLLLVFIKAPFQYIVVTILAVQMMGNAFIWFFFIKNTLINNNIDWDSFNYTIKLSMLSSLWFIKMHLDKIILSYYVWFAQTWMYALASAISDQIYALWKIIWNLLMPKTATLSREEVSLHKRKIIGIMFAVFFSISIFLISIYPIVIPFLFGPDFYQAVFYAQILTGFVTIKSIFIALQMIDNSQKSLQSTVFSSTISPVIELSLMVILWYYFGILGIIEARIIWDVLNFTYSVFFDKKNTYS